MAGAPVPRTDAPVQVPDEQAAARATVDGAPEEDQASGLPLFRDDLRMDEQVLEDAGVQNRNLVGFEFVAQLVTFDRLAVRLVFREVQTKLGRIEFELAIADDMLLDLPAIFLLPLLRKGRGREVDDVLHDLDDTGAQEKRKDRREEIPRRHFLHLFVGQTVASTGERELVCLTGRHFKLVTHDMFSQCDMSFWTRRVYTSGLLKHLFRFTMARNRHFQGGFWPGSIDLDIQIYHKMAVLSIVWRKK